MTQDEINQLTALLQAMINFEPFWTPFMKSEAWKHPNEDEKNYYGSQAFVDTSNCIDAYNDLIHDLFKQVKLIEPSNPQQSPSLAPKSLLTHLRSPSGADALVHDLRVLRGQVENYFSHRENSAEVSRGKEQALLGAMSTLRAKYKVIDSSRSQSPSSPKPPLSPPVRSPRSPMSPTNEGISPPKKPFNFK